MTSSRAIIGLVTCLVLATPVRGAAAQELPLPAGRQDESLRPELDAITARGRILAEYDQAAWHGTDAVLALHPDQRLVRGYLARRRADGLWEVVFGRLDDQRNAFLIAYRAVQQASGDTNYVATAVSPRESDTDWYARAARALDVARGAFGPAKRPYNAMVVPSSEGGLFVYLVPSPTQPGVYPLGGDVRYQVSSDGRTLYGQRRLHNTVLEYRGLPERAGGKPVASYHTAVLDDRPEDTDVFHVMSRQPKFPEYIASASYFFRVDLDGRIAAFRRDGAAR